MILHRRHKDDPQVKKTKRSWLFVLLGISSFAVLVLLIAYLPPDSRYSFLSIQVSVFAVFFLILFLFLFSTGSFLFKSKIHGVLIALLVITYLVFRLNNLTHPFFAILLLALFLVLELLFTYRK